MPFQQMRGSHRDELVINDVSDLEEGNAISMMKAFECQSMTELKHQSRKGRGFSTGGGFSIMDDKQTIKASMEDGSHFTDLQNKKTILRGNTQAQLRELKIDQTIFINIKKGKVTENYSIDNLLGEGTYGKVLLVTHRKTGIKRALKSRDRLRSDQARKRPKDQY